MKSIKSRLMLGMTLSMLAAGPAFAAPATAWQEFSKNIGEWQSLVENAPMPNDDGNRAEGYRSLARFLSNSLERSLDSNDPDFPRLLRMPNSIARIGWDNPDNVYLSTPIRGDHTYRIRGNLGSVNFISFNVYNGFVGAGMKSDVRSVGGLKRSAIKTDAQGNFELILSPDPHPGNWIKLEKDAQNLTIRQVFNDWENERPASLDIVNLTTQGTYPKSFDERQLAEQLQESVKRASDLRAFFNQAHSRLFSDPRTFNTVTPPSVKGVGLGMDDPNNSAGAGRFKLAADEALVLTVPPSKCTYTNIQLGNLWWESLDYANRQSHLNGKMARVDADGKTRYVISERDPGVPNWLDTAGHSDGTLFMRFTDCSVVPAAIESQVVKLDKLRTVLPKNTPTISASKRLEAIDMRQRTISRRLAGGG